MLRLSTRHDIVSGGSTIRSERGFTVIEVMVTAIALGLIMIAALGLYGELGRVAMTSDTVARTQSDIRVAIDELEKNLRAAGNDIDYARGQERLVFAGPYQVVFNADLMPLVDDDDTGAPGALNVEAGGHAVPSSGSALYVPPLSYTTGAETVVFTLDSNLDGVIDADDKGDDIEEESPNPNDYVLYRMIYGFNGEANSVEATKVALIRGPEPDADGTPTAPLFSYFIDHDDDRDTPPILHGDANGDGEVSGAELLNAAPLSAGQLARVERVALRVTGEATRPDGDYDHNDGYRRLELTSEVQLRQQPRVTGIIYGLVFQDLDRNGLYDVNEQAVAGVTIQSSNGAETETREDGTYRLLVTPGPQTITEIDPNGYASSTPNSVNVDVYPGAFMNVNFGDYTASGSGSVAGVVFLDVDQDGTWNPSQEPGLPGVKVYSDTGEYAFTQTNGVYNLAVPAGIRTITQVDLDGYYSTTPNVVEVEVVDGQAAQAFFGDTEAVGSGTIKGMVFLDENGNRAYDPGEGGVPGAQIIVESFTTESDNAGLFSLTVPAGTHSVTEVDPPGYSSTTPNTLNNIEVVEDQSTIVYFGDRVEEEVNFDIIELADTERALSIGSGNLREDNRGDSDLVLGTRFTGGSNNLLVWHNQRINSRTPNSAIFESVPSYTRPNVADVLALQVTDLNADDTVDVLAGLAESSYGRTINVWLGSAGSLQNTPDYAYLTQTGGSVADLGMLRLDRNGYIDFLAGVVDADLEGHFEVWWGTGGGQFGSDRGDSYQYSAAILPELLGAVTAVAAADINGDGWDDVVIGSREESSRSSVNVFIREWATGLGRYIPWQHFIVQGGITDLAVADMAEDDDGDLDIVVAVQAGETTGWIELWHQKEDGRFGIPDREIRVMDDMMRTAGAPLTMQLQHIDNDVFPDIIVGTRAVSPFGGHVQMARTFGHLPTEPDTISQTGTGTVVTMTVNDFNLDGRSDFAVGTQNGNTTGRVIVFFRQ